MDEEVGEGMNAKDLDETTFIAQLFLRAVEALESIAAAQPPPWGKSPATKQVAIQLHHCQYSGCQAAYYEMEDLRTHRHAMHGE